MYSVAAAQSPPFSKLTITGKTKSIFNKVSLFENGSSKKPFKTEKIFYSDGEYSIKIDIPRDMKKKIMAVAGVAVYIDYEDGLYKVRVGDFATRSAASEARARLSADYPECWIVRTTVMKAK